MPSTKLGPYELLELVGEGGMGEVWKARDTRLDRIVAITRLRGEVSARFKQKARAVSARTHPHICTLYDVGTDDGTPYPVMEFVEGRTARGPVPIREALRHGIQIASALAAAHRAGIVHRDLIFLVLALNEGADAGPLRVRMAIRALQIADWKLHLAPGTWHLNLQSAIYN